MYFSPYFKTHELKEKEKKEAWHFIKKIPMSYLYYTTQTTCIDSEQHVTIGSHS